jgi:cardiolipin synthase
VNGPNLLTLSRIALALPIALAIVGGHPVVAFILLLLALVTDFLDGAIARHGQASSDLGRVLDPLADKVLVAGIVAALVRAGRVPIELVLVVVGRDVLLLAFGWLRMKAGGEVPKAEAPGKVAFGILGVYLAGEVLGLSWPAWAPVFVGAAYLLGAVGYVRRIPGLAVGRVAKGER